jgi:hypothetical protein
MAEAGVEARSMKYFISNSVITLSTLGNTTLPPWFRRPIGSRGSSTGRVGNELGNGTFAVKLDASK